MRTEDSGKGPPEAVDTVQANVGNHEFIWLSAVICTITQVLGCTPVCSIGRCLFACELCRWKNQRKAGRESRTIRREKQNRMRGGEDGHCELKGSLFFCFSTYILKRLISQIEVNCNQITLLTLIPSFV